MIERISNRSLAVDTTSVTVSDTLYNGKRNVLFISNTSTGGQNITIAVGQEATAGQGIIIGPGGFYQDSKGEDYNPTNEEVNAISSAAGGTIAIHERVIMPGV